MHIYVHNDLFLIKSFSDALKLKKFETEEAAQEFIQANIESMDNSGLKIALKEIQIPSVLISKRNKKFSQTFSYNVLEYIHEGTGFTFNFCVILWNKETNQYGFKLIEKQHLDKLLTAMPKLDFLETLKFNFLENLSRIKSINDIRNYVITSNGTNLPLSYKFKFSLRNTYVFYTENNETSQMEDFNTVLEEIYSSYIGKHF